MTRSAKIGIIAGVALLVAVIVVQSVLLLQRQRELTRYRASDQQRREFCVAYAGMISALQRGLKGAQDDAVALRRPTDQTQARIFAWLTEPAFLNVCRIPEPVRSEIADRDTRCLRARADGVGSEYDLQCLEALAQRLGPAVSLE